MVRLSILYVFCVIIFISLTACSSIDTKVTIYHQPHIHHVITGKTYTFVALEKLHQAHNLQYDYIKHFVSTYLKSYMKPTVTKTADFNVVLIYWVGHDHPYVSYQPVFGRTGTDITGSYTTGNVNGTTTYSGNTGYTSGNLSSYTTYTTRARYGVTGYVPELEHLYPYFFDLYIYKNNHHNDDNILRGEPVYYAHLVASDNEHRPSKIFPLMIKALFKIFPGKNGTSKIIRVAP